MGMPETHDYIKLSITRLKKRQRLLAALILLLTFAGSLTWFKLRIQSPSRVKLGKESSTYENQIKTLESILYSIENLADFVVKQKHTLQESQHLLNDLKSKHEQLRPIVETDRKVVEAILQTASEKRKRDIWSDRIIAFIAGIIASLLAQLILSVIKLRPTKR